jgi:hypothetical protein
MNKVTTLLFKYHVAVAVGVVVSPVDAVIVNDPDVPALVALVAVAACATLYGTD